jgi:hypothetical protein
VFHRDGLIGGLQLLSAIDPIDPSLPQTLPLSSKININIDNDNIININIVFVIWE